MPSTTSIPATKRSEISKLWKPKAFIFLAAGLSFLGSVYLWFQGMKEQGVFVGLWVPSILAAGALLMVGEARRRD